MIPGDEWQNSQAQIPTPADMLKYAATGARLLIELPWAMNPTEIVISGVMNRGEVFCYNLGSGLGFDRNWQHTSAIRVVGILPPPQPPKPKTSELTNDVLTKALSKLRHPSTE